MSTASGFWALAVSGGIIVGDQFSIVMESYNYTALWSLMLIAVMMYLSLQSRPLTTVYITSIAVGSTWLSLSHRRATFSSPVLNRVKLFTVSITTNLEMYSINPAGWLQRFSGWLSQKKSTHAQETHSNRRI